MNESEFQAALETLKAQYAAAADPAFKARHARDSAAGLAYRKALEDSWATQSEELAEPLRQYESSLATLKAEYYSALKPELIPLAK